MLNDCSRYYYVHTVCDHINPTSRVTLSSGFSRSGGSSVSISTKELTSHNSFQLHTRIQGSCDSGIPVYRKVLPLLVAPQYCKGGERWNTPAVLAAVFISVFFSCFLFSLLRILLIRDQVQYRLGL